MAERLNVSTRSYAAYERAEADMPTYSLDYYAGMGWNMNWLFTGNGPEMVKALQDKGSHHPRLEQITLAVQLAQDALDGDTLEPNDYGQLVTLIYDALENGLPNAQVIAFARPAARGLSKGNGSDGSDVGRTGKGAAG